MPGLDKTGPVGQGPLTGGGFGSCSGDAATVDSSAISHEELCGAGRGGLPWGGGRGRCFGGGRKGLKSRGIGRRYSDNNEKSVEAGFANQIAQLIKDIDKFHSRLDELVSKQKE